MHAPRSLAAAICTSTAVTAAPVWAQSEPAGGFGKRGQIALSSDFDLSFSVVREIQPSGDEPDDVTRLTLAPALDYFLADRWSLGAQVSYTRTSVGEDRAIDFGVGPVAGVVLPLSAVVSFWPRIGLAYRLLSTTTTQQIDPATGARTNETFDGSALTVRADVPLLMHPARHFFLGLGPFASVDAISRLEGDEGVRRTEIGVATWIGGWF
jgi:hypothetical protein